MGMEQGEYIEYGGGGGDYGGMDYGGELFVDVGGFGGGGGGGDFVLDPGFGLDLSGGDVPDILSPGGDAIAWGNLGPVADQAWLPDLPFYQGPSFGDISLTPAPSLSEFGSGNDTFGNFFDYFSAQGYDDYMAMQLAAQEVSELAVSIPISTFEQAPPPTLPDLPETSFPYYPLPYVDYWQTPYTPTFPDLPVPPPPVSWPSLPLIPPPMPPSVPGPMPGGSGGTIPKAPGLPPACATGSYHPYPQGHPQQNICVPFPPPQAQAPKPPSATATGQPSSSKPPSQQQQQQPKCPTGYYLDPLTKQCKPIPQGQPQQCPSGYYRASNGQCYLIPRCTTPGTVFDAARGLCVPQGQAISPLPEDEFGDLFSNLKNIPWWVWAALAGAFLLSQGGEERKKVTVQHRRAT